LKPAINPLAAKSTVSPGAAAFCPL